MYLRDTTSNWEFPLGNDKGRNWIFIKICVKGLNIEVKTPNPDGLIWPLKIVAQDKSQDTISDCEYPLGGKSACVVLTLPKQGHIFEVNCPYSN